ncbi:uncharacterized protein LOC119566280 [Chelonia mydas]|uniref:uncharacterized protein LOC119566280 n=1 Tax=Chelonia mydas TaxID=8469 RepID=UPI0018A1E5BC|nr:uncharacterized protein LOC119566280 [Chelonia mydas]
MTPPPIRAQHHHPIRPSVGQKRLSFTKSSCFRNRGNMDSFTTPVRTSDFVLAPRAFNKPRRKRYISDSSEEEEGAIEGSPLAKPLMDTPDPETQPLMGPRDERDGLLLSTPREEEGDRSSGKSLVDKMNAQLDDAFLEDPETLDSVAPSSEDEPGPPCFCSTPIQNVEEDSEDDGYEEFRRRLGMELTEPVPRRERNKVMRTIVCIAVYSVLNHCLREKLFEDG